jgi:alpha-L-arabinofuranosidase
LFVHPFRFLHDAVKHQLTALSAIALSLALATPGAAQDQIVVDVTTVVADVSRRPIGINVNFLLDDDAQRPAAINDLAQALRNAGVKYLRYPGGEKSDNYLWSVPPFTSAMPALARWAAGEYPQNQEWPSYDRKLVETDGRTFKVSPLDFDEFMQVCRAIDCVPTIVICYDSMYKPAQSGGVAPTREQLLQTAAEWVRYANVVKRHGIKYWEIGNETWMPHYNGSATASNYARDLIDFSRAMKAVDPSIQIGANGEYDSWWRTVLSTASSAIDFLAVHNYPAYNWGSFAYYQQNAVNLMGVVQAAERAINSYAPAADRERLYIAATEVNSADWSGSWPHRNDLGHAITLFDMLGAHLLNPRVAFTQLWNTRWSGNETAVTPSLWDAFDKHNELQATGRVTGIWGAFLKNTLVSSTSTASVRSYTTYSAATGRFTVFLINKDAIARAATVTINGGGLDLSVDTWVFTGTGDQDLYPTWTHHGQNWTGNVIAATLPPVSVTVLDVTPDGVVHRVPSTIQAEDFAERASWDSTPGNTGGMYRASNVDIQATSDAGRGFNVGWVTAGERLGYTVHVAAAGQYDFAARVASPFAGKAFRVLVNGQDVSGAVSVPQTGDWQNWQTVTTRAVSLPAGTHRITIAALTDGFNINWWSFSPAAAVASPLPGVVQAEDFADGAFADSTPGNTGGAYRATDVDIEASTDTGGGFNVGWTAAGEWLEYVVKVTTPGYYDLSARVASPFAGKALSMSLNGSDITGSMVIPVTGGWQLWQTVTRSHVYLPAGTHRLRVTALTDGFNLNWLSVSVPPQRVHAVPGILQSEDFDDGAYWDSTPGNAGGAFRATDVDIQPTTDVGGGFNIGWNTAGEWQEFTIGVAAAGQFDIHLRVASPNTGRALQVLLNGSDATGVVTVPTTGGHQTWQTITVARVSLAAGLHRLRYLALSSGFNVNWISLTAVPK